MRKVTHYINEKFMEHGDVISDMSIGIISQLKSGSVLKCIKEIKPRLSSWFKGFNIKEGNYSVIKKIKFLKNKIDIELATYDRDPHIRKADLEFVGGEYLTLTYEQFFEHFEIIRTDLYEKFSEESDPIKDMSIGYPHFLYDIKKDHNGDYSFHVNIEKIIPIIKKNNPGISKNEIERFLAFSMDRIYQHIPNYYFETNNLKTIDALIERGIEDESQGWMGMHSDKAMKTMFNRR
jgi:hypothetical protein